MCAFNRVNASLDDNLRRLASSFPQSSMELLDQQSWFAIEVPAGTPVPGQTDRSAVARQGAGEAGQVGAADGGGLRPFGATPNEVPAFAGTRVQ